MTRPPLAERQRLQLSGHMELEILVSAHRGRPIDEGEAVPGCGCVVCTTTIAGGDHEDVGIARHLVERLARLYPMNRPAVAERAVEEWAEHGAVLPSPGLLGALATRVPGARRDPPPKRPGRRFMPLPVEESRAVPILDVCNALGLDLKRVGRTWRCPCPVHGGYGLNFSVIEDRGARCWTCGWTGDALSLWIELRSVEFHEAVRAIAEIGPAYYPAVTDRGTGRKSEFIHRHGRRNRGALVS